MDAKMLNLSGEQWDFLAVLFAMEKAVSLEIAGQLSPILPAPFLDMMGRNNMPELIKSDEANRVFLSQPILPGIMDKLKTLNGKEKISALIDRLYELNLIDQIDPDIVSKLLSQAGRSKDIAEIEIRLARKALKNRDQYQAMQHLWHVVRQLYDMIEDTESQQLFVSATLKLSDLCFSLGTGFMELPRFLKKALTMTEEMGDRRSHALVNLNLSIFFHIARQHDESLRALSAGLKEVEALGDEDILNRSAAFIGLNFFLQGLFRDAEPYLERAALDFDLQGGESMTIGPLPMPFLLGYCLANLGHFHDAVGGLERSLRLAKSRSQDALATTIRSILGAVLQMVDRRKEALFHLTVARKEALENNNSFAFLIAEGSLIYQSYLEGKIDKVLESMDGTGNFAEDEGYARLYTAPHIFEMIYDIETMGYPPHPRLNFKYELNWIEKAPNIHAKGAAYRLLAKTGMKKEEEYARIEYYLDKSESFILKSGDPMELAKTWLESARLNVLKKNLSKARTFAQKAHHILVRHPGKVFPDDLKGLLRKENESNRIRENYSEFLRQIMRIFEHKTYGENVDQILGQILKYACRLFLSERGAVFQMNGNASKSRPGFMAGYNISETDTAGDDFIEAWSVIETVMKTKQPVVKKYHADGSDGDYFPIRSAMCLPMKKGDQTNGVFYFDNIYLDNRFDLLDEKGMEQAAMFMGDYLEQMMEFTHLKKETSIWSSTHSFQIARFQKEEFVFESQVMTRLISEAKQVAKTDTTILILGETGVGKEVLARQIHHMSSRHTGPFEVVDLTAIPESLMESELFGYEKGAFTGAEQQKRGRFELTRKGTLFLDEIGEIPASFQVKLLRVLQEKTFVRVGGTKTLTSDFRLIAATNRDLENEVAAGNFRQDLFYRLNMMPITIPPLREREDDVILLARHFLSQYAVKHNKPSLRMWPEDITILTAYPWPGNIRELKNVMERAVLLSKNERLDFGPLHGGGVPPYAMTTAQNNDGEKTGMAFFKDMPTLEELERRYIRYVLDKTNGKIGGPDGAGEALGLKRTTLYSRMKKLGLEIKK